MVACVRVCLYNHRSTATFIFPMPNSNSSAAEQVQQQNATAIVVKDVDFHYNSTQALFDINIDIPRHKITAFIGPSGCGKSTLLRCFNRMNDRISGAHVSRGSILVEGTDLNAPDLNHLQLRREVGMVFQKSNPFPMSIAENVAYGLKIAGVKNKKLIAERVEKALQGAALWDEVKDRLKDSAFALSGGQQQRLCIARAIAVEPKVLLMDEPCSALDPIATVHVEELMHELKEHYTLVVVTHNMQQATRVSDFSAYFMQGKLIEFSDTYSMFSNPKEKATEDYITGKIS